MPLNLICSNVSQRNDHDDGIALFGTFMTKLVHIICTSCRSTCFLAHFPHMATGMTQRQIIVSIPTRENCLKFLKMGFDSHSWVLERPLPYQYKARAGLSVDSAKNSPVAATHE